MPSTLCVQMEEQGSKQEVGHLDSFKPYTWVCSVVEPRQRLAQSKSTELHVV